MSQELLNKSDVGELENNCSIGGDDLPVKRSKEKEVEATIREKKHKSPGIHEIFVKNIKTREEQLWKSMFRLMRPYMW